MGQCHIEGNYVRIRTLERRDCPAVLQMLKDDDAKEFLQEDSSDSEEDALAFIERTWRPTDKGGNILGVEHKEEGELIGVTILPTDQNHSEGRIGLWLKSPYLEKGYSREVMQVLVANVFTNVNN